MLEIFIVKADAPFFDIVVEDWMEYMDTAGEKSELGFYNFLFHTKKKTWAQARNEIA
ncbi:unnamed protein product, partial [marine sediment metagenome]